MKNKEMKIEQFGTKLTIGLIREAIVFNGFVPVSVGEHWCSFKVQGHEYFVGYEGKSIIQFYKDYHLTPKDSSIDYLTLKQASVFAIHDMPMGKITFKDDGDDSWVQYRLYGIEKTYEHLCLSFMDYVRELECIIEAHSCEYRNEIEDSEREEMSILPEAEEKSVTSKVCS